MGCGVQPELSSLPLHKGDGVGQGVRLSCHRCRCTKEMGQGRAHG